MGTNNGSTTTLAIVYSVIMDFPFKTKMRKGSKSWNRRQRGEGKREGRGVESGYFVDYHRIECSVQEARIAFQHNTR